MRTSPDLLRWRNSLEDGPPAPDAQELRDWAAILAQAGETAGARCLEDIAAIRTGFPRDRSGDDGATRWTIERAFAELDALAADFTPRIAPTPPPRVSGRPDEEGGIGPASPARAFPNDIPETAAKLRALLSGTSLGAEDAASLHNLLAALIEADACLPALDYRTWLHAPLDELAMAIATASLIDFALSVRDLLGDPLGAPELLWRTASLDREGLGPYLAGVGRIVRNSGDVFDLARRAAPDGDTDALEAWIALLARGCSGLQFFALIDDLGDLGLSRCLGRILDRALARPSHLVALPIVWRIRDAALDNADWTLAVRAQSALVRLRPEDYHEEVILGSIQASGGDYGAAEWTFRHCLIRQPDDLDTVTRLRLVKHDTFRDFEVTRGYDSPAARQEARLRRRGAMAEHMPRSGQRIRAVDVS